MSMGKAADDLEGFRAWHIGLASKSPLDQFNNMGRKV